MKRKFRIMWISKDGKRMKWTLLTEKDFEMLFPRTVKNEVTKLTK